jgi:hypothetical protein
MRKLALCTGIVSALTVVKPFSSLVLTMGQVIVCVCTPLIVARFNWRCPLYVMGKEHALWMLDGVIGKWTNAVRSTGVEPTPVQPI